MTTKKKRIIIINEIELNRTESFQFLIKQTNLNPPPTYTHTPLQNNIRVFKVQCWSVVRFGRALLGFPITVHHLCACLMYLEC